jgi:tetratricopeptide (TPR) repeat protein
MFLQKLFSLLGDNGLGRGLEAMKAGRLREAIRIFLPYLEDSDPGIRERARLYCCEANLQLGDEIRASDPTAALRCYREAHALQPGFADVAHRCGQMHRVLGEVEEAQEAFGRALEINPAFLDARLALVGLCLERGQETEAAGQIAALSANAPSLFEIAGNRVREEPRTLESTE